MRSTSYSVASIFLALALAHCGGKTSKGAQEGGESKPAPTITKVAAENPFELLETNRGELKVTPLWHGTLAFEFQGKVIIVDPWSKAPAGRMPKADLVLITDIHQDHFDAEAIAQVRKPEGIVIAPQVVVTEFPSAEPMANGDIREVLGEVRIRAVPMYNKKRGPEEGKLFHDKGRGNGYVLEFGNVHVYVSGDTECINEMRGLRDIDLAFVCMNLPYTMPPEEAAECIREFRPKILIPYHYRGSDLDVLQAKLADEPQIEVRIRDFYRE